MKKNSLTKIKKNREEEIHQVFIIVAIYIKMFS